MYTVSFLAIGSELLDGRVVDTNSVFLSRSLISLGINVNQKLSCDDQISEIKDALAYLSKTSNCIIVTGGLGPTSDDLTREAIAEFVNTDLELDEESLQNLKALYTKRHREMDPSNVKQATFPKTSTVILNPIGTAPGFSIKVPETNVVIISLPGVPRELVPMFEETVLPYMKSILPADTPQLSTHGFCLFGLPESVIGSKIKALKLPNDISVSYRASFPEVHVLLKRKGDLEPYIHQVVETLGREYIFAENLNTSLMERVHRLLSEKEYTLSVVESCTGGLLGELLTRTPGSSKNFKGGIIAYSNEVKSASLDVPKTIIEDKGAVSHEVAAHLALSVNKVIPASFSLSITGVAGPDGGTVEKPVGTFYIGFCNGKEVYTYKCFYLAERDMIRKYAAYKSLDILRRHLRGYGKPDDCEVVRHFF